MSVHDVRRSSLCFLLGFGSWRRSAAAATLATLAATAAAGAGDDIRGSIPAGEYSVQRWAPPTSPASAPFLYLLTVPGARATPRVEAFFVTDLGTQGVEAIAADVAAHARVRSSTTVVVEPVKHRDGSLVGYVIRSRDVRFGLIRRGPNGAIFVDAGDSVQSGSGGGGGGGAGAGSGM
jgi:hypothetical protein